MSATVAMICDRLRDAILTGELEPGKQDTQMSLAERFGASRTPLREALRILELEGLVLRESNGRFRITPVSVGHIEDLAVMRVTVEALAVNLTVPAFGHAEHAKLENCLAQIERYAAVDDWEGIETPHRDFHRLLVNAAGDRVTSLLDTFWDHASRYRGLAFQQLADHVEAWDISRAEHRAIVDAFEAYDARTAVGWEVTQIARTAIMVARRINPSEPLTRLHDLVERYTGRRDLA